MSVAPPFDDPHIPDLLRAGACGDPQALLRIGMRRLMAIGGDGDWVAARARTLRQQTVGDWIWVGGDEPESTAFGKMRSLLGQEFRHAIFDARTGFDVEALAILCGTLRAGSWLLLLTPPWERWAQLPDADSLRWSEQPQAIATPHFIAHFQRQLRADPDVVLWRQGEPLVMAPLAAGADWRPATGAPTAQQQAILAQLRDAAAGVYVVTAPRGRGKSTLAGMLAQQSAGTCWITSPARDAVTQLTQAAAGRGRFWAPDALLAYCETHTPPAIDWLLIDEAAAIPTAQLLALVRHFPRVLMTTTVHGYEGTGRGFLLKFCAALPQCCFFSLSDPLRWAVGDPLERVLDNALLLDAETVPVGRIADNEPALTLTRENIASWLAQPAVMRASYALLCSAHYRTSPLDLRRLLDAPGMHFYCARRGASLHGIAWWVDEGGLTRDVAHDVWAGRRRPRGSLVAQSLAAHGDEWLAPHLHSRRISRIAVAAAQRRTGIGRALVACQQAQATDVDFLSVSFGYQPALWAFWADCGFRLVRIGSHREASSGCYSAMAIMPLSEAGRRLTERAERQLARDWGALRRLIPLALPLEAVDGAEQSLNADDWRALAGFAFAHRAMEPSFAALSRLLAHETLSLPALRLLMAEPLTPERGVAALGLSGKKALLQRWRQETAQALMYLDGQSCERWRRWVLPGGASADESVEGV